MTRINIKPGKWTRRLGAVLVAGMAACLQLGAATLLDVDFGGGDSTSEVGSAATGHSASDFWNYYTRNDSQGGWLTFGFLSNLKTVEGLATAAGLTIANAPGSWGNGSADDMYNSYDYPFDGGNVTVAVTNLDAGAYDFYVYGIDSSYELTVNGLSYGIKPLPGDPVVNPVVWQEDLQYALFRSVRITNGANVTLTVRPGAGGYATISGMQIASVVPTNHAPVANSQNVMVGEGSSTPITLSGSDLDGDALTYTIASQPAHGVLTGSAPNLTYAPAGGYSGPDSFTFTVNDGQVDSSAATVSISVLPTSNPLLINLDIGGGASTSEVGPAATGHDAGDFWNYYTRNDGHGGWLTFGFLSNLETAEGAGTAVGFTIANAPGAWGNGSADDMYNGYDYPFNGGNVTMTVTNLAAGAYDFYVYGLDSRYELTVDGFSYGVKPLPNGPVVNPVVWQENLQYARFRSVRVTNSAVVTVTVRPGAGGYATISGMQIASVIPTNHPPVANNKTIHVSQDGSTAITLSGSDPDGDALTYTVASTPAHGALSGTAPNLTYAPAGGYSGPDSFTFTVNDGQADSAAATVSITVFSNNVPLLINLDISGGASTSEVGPAATGHSASDFWNYYTRNDGHGGWLTFGFLSNLETAEGAGTAVGFTIANAPGAWGNGSADDMYNSYDYPFDGGNVTMTVTNLDSGAYDFYVYGIDSSYEVTVNGSSYGIKPLPGGPVVNPVVWQENLQYALFRSVRITNGAIATVTVRPGAGGYATISGLQIASVAPTNHAPVANGQTVLVSEDGSTPITLSGSDQDGDALTYAVASPPVHGALTGSAPNLTYTPSTGYSGPDSFIFTVNDGQVDSAAATVNVNVFHNGTDLLIDVDFGGGDSTSEVGPAATGHSASDFWNYYTRNDGQGGWLTFGFLSNLKTVEGVTTTAGLTIANAPGSWGNGSADDMYNSYDYPFDGGNVTVTVTNLDPGAYDFYVYGIDSSYELAVNGLSYGAKPLPGDPVVNPVVWQEGLQYVLFRGVQITNGDIVTLTAVPGAGGYATISGMQIGLNPPPSYSHPAALHIPALFAPTAVTLPAIAITSTHAVLDATVNPHGAPTTVWFDWGTTTNYANSTVAQSAGSASSNITVRAVLNGLAGNQTYFFRVRAANAIGSASGADLSFARVSTRPVINALTHVSNTGFALRFTGVPHQTYIVQGSTDLMNWSVLGTASDLGNGSFEFDDPEKLPARYYRVFAP